MREKFINHSPQSMKEVRTFFCMMFEDILWRRNMNKRTISVIGLGYVGLPVAAAFGMIGKTIGFDVNAWRVKELKDGFDRTGEVESEELESPDIFLPNGLKN